MDSRLARVVNKDVKRGFRDLPAGGIFYYVEEGSVRSYTESRSRLLERQRQSIIVLDLVYTCVHVQYDD